MTWEWVTLILGIIFLIVVLFGWVAWVNTNARMVESYPKTIPDILARTQQKEKDASP